MAENNPIEGLETQLKENKEVNEEIGPTEKEKLTEEEKQPPTTMAEELKSPATSEDFFGFESEPTELIELLKNGEISRIKQIS